MANLPSRSTFQCGAVPSRPSVVGNKEINHMIDSPSNVYGRKVVFLHPFRLHLPPFTSIQILGITLRSMYIPAPRWMTQARLP